MADPNPRIWPEIFTIMAFILESRSEVTSASMACWPACIAWLALIELLMLISILAGMVASRVK